MDSAATLTISNRYGPPPPPPPLPFQSPAVAPAAAEPPAAAAERSPLSAPPKPTTAIVENSTCLPVHALRQRLRQLRARRKHAGDKGSGDKDTVSATNAGTSSSADAEVEAEEETSEWAPAAVVDVGRAPVGMTGVSFAEDIAAEEARGPAAVRAGGGVNSPALYAPAAGRSGFGGTVEAGVDLDNPSAVCPRPGEDALHDAVLWTEEDVIEEEVTENVAMGNVVKREKTEEENAGLDSHAEPHTLPRTLPHELAPTLTRSLPPPANVGFVKTRMDRVKQTMRGFGFSNAFWTHIWDSHKHRDRIYHTLFAGLQPAIIRLRNVHAHEMRGVDSPDVVMEADERFLDGAQYHLGYRPEILLTSWTPPRALKENNNLMGGGDDATLRKDERGWFMYGEFAQWWVDSLHVYRSRRLMPAYLSIQNEPDYSPTTHQACKFLAYESYDIAGFYQANKSVHAAVSKAFPGNATPAFIGGESFRMDGYMLEFPYATGGIFTAYAGHLYASGTADNPNSYNDALRTVRSIAASKQVPEVWMSEFAFLGKHKIRDPLRLAIVIHNTLTLSDATCYLHWDGLWPVGVDNDEGTMIMVEPMQNEKNWRNKYGFEIKHSFWWLMHFTRTIRPGYRRVDIDLGIRDVLVSAWTGPNGHFAIIIINTSSAQAFVTLSGLPEWVASQETKIFFSTLSKGYTEAGALQGNFVSVLPESIYSVISYASS